MKKPARVTKDTCSFIDILATTHEQNVRRDATCPLFLSDLDLVGVILKGSLQRFTPRRMTTRNCF